MMTAPAVPGRQQVSVLRGQRDLRLQDRPVPRPGPSEVLVAIRSVGVCGSDVHYYEEGRIGDYVVEQPLILGHEAAGVVVATGEQAHRHPLGQRVALEPGVPCGVCRPCRSGHYNLCPYVRFFATPPVDGAFAPYVRIDENFAHALPERLSDDEGALLEPLSVAVWAGWKAGLRAGDDVLVTGAGPVGLLCLQIARASGATSVVVTDVSAARLALAARLGATRTLDGSARPLQDAGLEVDVLLECSGAPAAVDAGIRSLRPAGRAVLVGMNPQPVTALPIQVIQNREITLTGTFRYANTYPTAIALVSSGAVDLGALVTSHHDLDDVEGALTAGARDPTSVKPVVHPSPP